MGKYFWCFYGSWWFGKRARLCLFFALDIDLDSESELGRVYTAFLFQLMSVNQDALLGSLRYIGYAGYGSRAY